MSFPHLRIYDPLSLTEEVFLWTMFSAGFLYYSFKSFTIDPNIPSCPAHCVQKEAWVYIWGLVVVVLLGGLIHVWHGQKRLLECLAETGLAERGDVIRALCRHYGVEVGQDLEEEAPEWIQVFEVE
jgi:hypothetical protein